MYSFNEATLGPNFAKDKLDDFKKLIDIGTSFVTISMPGVGVSYFLKYLACQNWAYFVHIDLYSLPSLNLHEFYKLLLTELGGKTTNKPDDQLLLESKKILVEIAKKNKKVVLIFSRFDQLGNQFDANFLSNLQSLIGNFAGKIVLIFTSIKPLPEIAPEAVAGGNLTFYSKQLYFKPYSEADLKMLLEIDPEPTPSDSRLDKLIKLSGGHYQLLKILLNSQKQSNLNLDQFVRLQMKGLLDYLDYSRKKQIQKIALQPIRQVQGKQAQVTGSEVAQIFDSETITQIRGTRGGKLFEVDEYLVGVGMVNKKGSDYQLFTPLLSEYVKQNLAPKLPPLEAKLFRLLKDNLGKTVSKDEIFNTVWKEGSENVTDWALDALIYRLRKHPFIQSGGYIIESHKKVGYTLIQA